MSSVSEPALAQGLCTVASAAELVAGEPLLFLFVFFFY